MSELASRLRQRLLDATRRLQAQIERLVRERGPLIRGSFGTRARRCGAAQCRCVRGQLHQSKYLAATDQGKLRQVHVPVHEEGEVAAGVARYRQFAKARAELAALSQKQLELVDKLGRSLLKAYPSKRPLPPAGRRGRRRSGGSHEER